MDANELSLLWQGVQLCIATQLIVVGGFKFRSRKQLEIVLGFICLIISSYFFKTIFAHLIDDNSFLTFLLSGGLFFYYGPLLFVYVSLIAKKRDRHFFILHLLPPTCLHLLYGVTRAFFPDFFMANTLTINVAALIICLLSIAGYFYYGVFLFRNQLNQTLISKPRQKFRFFYYAINIFLLNEFLTAILVFLTRLTELPFLAVIDRYYISPFAEYIHVPLYVGLSVYLLLYALSQSKVYKSFFTPENIYIDPALATESDAITNALQVQFVNQKLYLKPGLRIKEVAVAIGLSNQQLATFLKTQYELSFSDYVNQHRVQEFLLMAQSENYTTFSLFGIAQEAGFKSKATFHRAFKKKYGLTPKQAIDRISAQ